MSLNPFNWWIFVAIMIILGVALVAVLVEAADAKKGEIEND